MLTCQRSLIFRCQQVCVCVFFRALHSSPSHPIIVHSCTCHPVDQVGGRPHRHKLEAIWEIKVSITWSFTWSFHLALHLFLHLVLSPGQPDSTSYTSKQTRRSGAKEYYLYSKNIWSWKSSLIISCWRLGS